MGLALSMAFGFDHESDCLNNLVIQGVSGHAVLVVAMYSSYSLCTGSHLLTIAPRQTVCKQAVFYSHSIPFLSLVIHILFIFYSYSFLILFTFYLHSIHILYLNIISSL